MNRILNLILTMFFILIYTFVSARNIGDNYQVIYNAIDTAGSYVSTQTITIAIQKTSNNYWYDFADDTFKISGWTSKTNALTEDTTNQFYYYTYTPPTSETVANQYLFVLNNDDAVYRDHEVLLVDYQDIGTSTATPEAVWVYSTKDIDTLTTNLDKTGYSGVLTENVTCYSNLDKTNYQLASNQEVRTTSITVPVADTIWQKNIDGLTGNSAGYYVLKSTNTSNGRDWTDAEKGNIKSCLTIEGSTPTWRLDQIDRDIRIFR